MGDNIHISTLMDKLGHSGINGPNTMGYAASVQGGDHTSTTVDGYNDMSGSVFQDSAVFCMFTAMGPSQELIFDFAKAITGFPITIESWRPAQGA